MGPRGGCDVTFWDFFDAHVWTTSVLILGALSIVATTLILIAGAGGLGLLARASVVVKQDNTNERFVDGFDPDDAPTPLDTTH